MSSNSGISDWSRLPLLGTEDAIAIDLIESSNCARTATLADVIDVLASPDSGLRLDLAEDGSLVSDSGERFELRGARPLLLPKYARDLEVEDTYRLSDQKIERPGEQYLYLSIIKMNGGPQNSDYNDIWFQRHFHRSRELLAPAKGLVLDIGCDIPSISRRMFPTTATFLGLEPSLRSSGDFCICGMAEHLPLLSESVDNVAFLTSLDHILDYQLAMQEAKRVLKPGGCLFLASLVWTHRASLIEDTVHFHHFRDFELLGVLQPLEVERISRYNWKNDAHRFGIYLQARKAR